MASKGMVPFLHLIEKLKLTKRTGWLDHGIPTAESIADHMHRMGVMAMLIDDPSLDKSRCADMACSRVADFLLRRCVKMAIVHVRA